MVVSFLLVLPSAQLSTVEKPPKTAPPQAQIRFPVDPRPKAAPAPVVSPHASAVVSLRDEVRVVDFALLKTMQDSGLALADMRVKDAALIDASETESDGAHLYQHLEVTGVSRPMPFMADFAGELKSTLPTASVERDGPLSWTVFVDRKATHQLDFILPDTPRAAREGKLLIVIDDLGRDRDAARRLAALDIPVVFSVLPNEYDTDFAVQTAKESEREIFLHQPMEPVNYPEKNPGDGALYTFMSPEDIRRVVSGNLARVPGAVGVNNHMGSAFTAAHGPMETFLRELKTRGLVFLDSLTTPETVVPLYCGRLGMRCFKRSIFLDNVAEESAVLDQLFEADYMAYATGRAVAIGHPYPETVSALEKWQKLTTRRAHVVSFALFTTKQQGD